MNGRLAGIAAARTSSPSGRLERAADARPAADHAGLRNTGHKRNARRNCRSVVDAADLHPRHRFRSRAPSSKDYVTRPATGLATDLSTTFAELGALPDGRCPQVLHRTRRDRRSVELERPLPGVGGQDRDAALVDPHGRHRPAPPETGSIRHSPSPTRTVAPRRLRQLEVRRDHHDRDDPPLPHGHRAGTAGAPSRRRRSVAPRPRARDRRSRAAPGDARPTAVTTFPCSPPLPSSGWSVSMPAGRRELEPARPSGDVDLEQERVA